jgi:hypothetical protein
MHDNLKWFSMNDVNPIKTPIETWLIMRFWGPKQKSLRRPYVSIYMNDITFIISVTDKLSKIQVSF